MTFWVGADNKEASQVQLQWKAQYHLSLKMIRTIFHSNFGLTNVWIYTVNRACLTLFIQLTELGTPYLLINTITFLLLVIGSSLVSGQKLLSFH